MSETNYSYPSALEKYVEASAEIITGEMRGVNDKNYVALLAKVS